MTLDTLVKQLANRVNQPHVLKHYFRLIYRSVIRQEQGKQLNLSSVSQQRELISWLKENKHLNKTDKEIEDILVKYNFSKLICG